ncbi:hypothetical protein D3C78_1605770 [compost metagenome]
MRWLTLLVVPKTISRRTGWHDFRLSTQTAIPEIASPFGGAPFPARGLCQSGDPRSLPGFPGGRRPDRRLPIPFLAVRIDSSLDVFAYGAERSGRHARSRIRAEIRPGGLSQRTH